MKLVTKVVSTAATAALCAVSVFAASGPHFVVTNDDVAGSNTATFYTISSSGSLKQKKVVSTGGTGLGGGYFATARVGVLHDKSQSCVYISDAASSDVAGIVVSSLKVAGTFKGSSTDSGNLDGIGLAMNDNYLYAGFTASNTIGTFKVLSGCKLKFVGDTPASGLNGGAVDGMKIHGKLMVVAYGDGSIESFNIANGKAKSNNDKADSTGFASGDYPAGVDITKDGKYAIFGDIPTQSTTAVVVEVANISGGNLKKKTKVYTVGTSFNSNNVLLSPDETLLYISNNQGGTVTAVPFNASKGTFGTSCASPVLSGFGSTTFYLGALANQNTTGTGGDLYVAEFGSPSAIGIVKVKTSKSGCSLTEAKGSPAIDSNSNGLLSIEAYPPRPF